MGLGQIGSMPWKSSDEMDEKRAFIERKLAGMAMSENCRLSGITRQTGYKTWNRFKAEGEQGLVDKSRAPKSNSRAVKGSTIELLVELRQKQPGWGPRKLIDVAAQSHPGIKMPAPSTLGEHLKKRGLVKKRTRRERAAKYHTELGGYHGPNAVWCADYKGQFMCGNRKLCYPLTISDGYSRMLLRCHGASGTGLRTAKKVFDAAFREFGLPDAIRTDNGTPFSGIHGLSQLSIWWVMLGIVPLRGRPGKPSDNGRHERIHKTMVDELLQFRIAPNLRAQQRDFDVFTKTYNEVRPHDALGGKTPSEVFTKSTRLYPTKLREPAYAEHTEVLRADRQGRIKLGRRTIALSPLLGQLPIGTTAASSCESAGIQNVFFGPIQLGYIHPKRGFLRGRPPRGTNPNLHTKHTTRVSAMSPV